MIKKLALIIALALTGCDSSSTTVQTPATNATADTTTTIHGRAKFVNGAMATDVHEIVIHGTEYSTLFEPDGTFKIEIPKSDADQTLVIGFHGDEIMHDSIKFPVDANTADIDVRATISGRNQAITFDSAIGGTFQNSDSYNRTKVTVPPQAFELPDGTVATGDVQVQITEADINNLSESGSWANNLYGTSEAEPSSTPLVTYGMAEFYFSQDGQKLQLRDGFTATIQMDLLESKVLGDDGFVRDAAVGDSVPLWYYDHNEVVWKHEGDFAYLQINDSSPTGFVQVGEVSHFSHYNTDRPCPPEPPPPPPVVIPEELSTPVEDEEAEPPPVCPDPRLTCYWDTQFSVDLIFNITLVDAGLNESYAPDSWNATIDGIPYTMTASQNTAVVASGVYTMDWLGRITGDEPTEGNVIVTLDDLRTEKRPGSIIDYDQIAAYNNLTNQEENTSFSIPWSWVDGDIVVSLTLNLPPD